MLAQFSTPPVTAMSCLKASTFFCSARSKAPQCPPLLHGFKQGRLTFRACTSIKDTPGCYGQCAPERRQNH
eukprot:1161656-Pelagomonas_calceolata.AAC.8